MRHRQLTRLGGHHGEEGNEVEGEARCEEEGSCEAESRKEEEVTKYAEH
jgi:hypothetical protein